MTDAEDVVRKFLAAWSKKDPENLATFVTDDVVFANVPIPQDHVQGRDNLREFWAEGLRGSSAWSSE